MTTEEEAKPVESAVASSDRQGRSAPWSLVAVLAVLLLVAVVVAAWLALDDDDDAGSAAGAGQETLGAQLFAQDDVPFTFDYPGSFATTEAPSGVLWVAGISPLDVIDVRRVADREFSAQGMTEAYGATLAAQKGIAVNGSSTRTTELGEAVVFDITSKSTDTTSQLVYLARAGSTWQIGCQSTAENKATIDAACEQLLRTLSPAAE